MQKSLKILYFTRVMLDTPDNGGALVCRHHVSQMARDPRLAVALCAVAGLRGETETQKFATSIGVPLLNFWPVFSIPPPQVEWPFFLELNALSHPQTDGTVLDFVSQFKPDVIVIDWLFTALFAPSLFRTAVRKVVITLNREHEFIVTDKKRQGLPSDPSEARLAEFEKAVYSGCNAIVALAGADIPSDFSEKGQVISPLFGPAARHWSHPRSNRILFVGNVNHYPNHQAVEWLCTRLAPALGNLDSGIRVQIVGADAKDVPHNWRQSNVDFLGIGDASLVTEQLIGVDLFVAPIANNFGSKIKLLSCLSHSTPFVATSEAMSGVSFLVDVPRIKLEEPSKAAQTICDLLKDERSLKLLSASLARQLSEGLKSQEGVWGDLFESVMRRTPSVQGLGVLDSTRAKLPSDLAFLKPMRGALCPCGSGKRYKHCHGRFA